ncbi:MAG: hypothetical protein JJU13_20645 [Balneolaceae bacterium]|nr:hypothetical protein [Balneolaceae bacterium]
MNQIFQIPYKNTGWYNVFIAGLQPACVMITFLLGANAPSSVSSGLLPVG